MFRSLKLGTAFGIGIYVHWSFPLLLVLVVYLTGGDWLPSLFVVSLVLLVFSCIILHELGHALMARRYGIQTRDITIFPIGGVARLERMSEKPFEEFMIAVAGPAVNVAIAAVLMILLSAGFLIATGDLASFGKLSGDVWRGHVSLDQLSRDFFTILFTALMLGNALLVGFNMIPAFPMDGGRVLRALLSHWIGHLPATEVAAALSVVLAAGMGLLGLIAITETSNPLPIIVSMFVLFAGQQELAAVRYRAAQRKAPPLDVLPVHGGQVRVQVTPPEPNFSGFTWDRQAGVWIEWREGRPVHACYTQAAWPAKAGEVP